MRRSRRTETWGPELGQPLEVSALVLLFEDGAGAGAAAGGCGLAPLSAAAVRAALLGAEGPSLQRTLQVGSVLRVCVCGCALQVVGG